MSRTITTMANSIQHPVRTGIFAVLGIIALGAVAGVVFGFTKPDSSSAQIVVIAPPVVTPVIVPIVPVTPIVTPIIIPIITPTPAPAPTPAPTDTGPDQPGNGSDGDQDITVTGPQNPTPSPTPVPPSDSLPPCCTEPTNVTTPPTITTPPSDVLPPCCTIVTPPVVPPTVPTPPSDVLPPCCTIVTPPVVPPTVPTPPSDVLPPCCTEITPPVVPPSDVLPPCCTIVTPPTPVTPVTPIVPVAPVIVPPVIVPPIIVPPTPVSRCTDLTISSSQVNRGDSITVSWRAENVDTITITNVGTFNGSQALAGSQSVVVNGDTTYVASVPGDEHNPNCAKSVTVTTRPTNETHSCVYLTADKTSANPGDTITLSWKTDNASSIIIDNGVGRVFPTEQGTASVIYNGDTTYHASVPGDENNPNCTVTVTTPTNGGGGGNGGGGHHGSSSKPDVYFSSKSNSNVYLSQIPYTGLDLGPIGTAVYWTLLVIWSLAAAYLILFGGVPFLRRKLAAFGANVGAAVHSAPAALLPEHAASAHQAPAVHQAVHTAAVAAAMPQVAPRTAPAPRMEMNGEGFKRFASTESLTIDDIVKGLSRESSAAVSQPEQQPSQEAQQPSATPRSEAPQQNERPQPVVAPVAPQAPRAVAKVEAPKVNGDVITFISLILAGERDAVFSTIRHLNQAGHDTEEFVAHAILALDDAYKARIDGTPVHEDVKRATDHCATPFLERLVSALTTAVDGSYTMGVTGIKLALTRALAVAQG